MWALRRASIHLRNRCSSPRTTRIFSVEPEIASCYLESYNAEFSQSQVITSFHNKCSSSKSFLVVQAFSSLAGAEGCGDHNDVLGDALTRLETRQDTVQEAASAGEMDDESISESELSAGLFFADDMQNELHMLDAASDVGEEKSSITEAPSDLIEALLSAPTEGVRRVLDGWVTVGNGVTPTEVSSIFLALYRRRMFDRALQVFEWLELKELLDLTESNYARHLDLVAKARGMRKAEQYIQQIPESHRREIVYCSLLKNYVAATNVHNTEKLFNKMKNLFPLTCISCNQLLFLYKKTIRKKINDVLLLMKKENIKPNNVTYQIMIDVKGQSRDIIGMEQVLEMMKADGVEPSLRNQASLAQYYAACGLRVKAEAILKDMEGGDLVKSRFASRFLLPVYAKLGREDEVRRIWKECESDPHPADCIAAMKAWGTLKRIEEAEAAFDKILEKNPISRHYAVLLDIYAGHEMVAKGEELYKRMTEGGATASGAAWDALVRLYAGAGELEKAQAFLMPRRRGRPSAASFLRLLDEYARRGDVSNSEMVFSSMRTAGYGVTPRPYHSLLYAYMNAKAPTGGFEERLRKDNVVPDEKLARLLARAASIPTTVT